MVGEPPAAAACSTNAARAPTRQHKTPRVRVHSPSPPHRHTHTCTSIGVSSLYQNLRVWLDTTAKHISLSLLRLLRLLLLVLPSDDAPQDPRMLVA